MLSLPRQWWRIGRKRLTAFRTRRLPAGLRLHVGCGPVHLDGWINIDNRPYPGTDYVLDVRDGVPFRELQYIFAEHFIEHLPYWQAHVFLAACRYAMDPAGILRISTPNLDWVIRTQYTFDAPETVRIEKCFAVNSSFRGWGHQFLYNRETLARLIRAAGFAEVQFVEYGHSNHPALRGLERHERSPDSPELLHVLVVEASGTSAQVRYDSLPGSPEFLNVLGAS